MSAVLELNEVTTPSQPTPSSFMTLASQPGANIEALERMWSLQVKYEERQAEKAFVAEMAEFKRNPPTILKDKHVKFGNTEYNHATHFGVTSAIIAGLAKHGISHRWDVDQRDSKIAVTCVLTHRDGHSQSTRLESAPDQSGGKNSIQAIVSAKSYLERHTLLAATGMSTADMVDDDGRGAGGGEPGYDPVEALTHWTNMVNAALTPEVLADTRAQALAEFELNKNLTGWTALKPVLAAKREALVAA